MKKISLAIMTLLVALSACKKVPEVNTEYVDVERDLITVGTTTATIQCDYEYIATLKKAFLYYCEGADTTNMSVAEMSVVQKTLYVELSGLKENTTYSYYYEFANGFNSMQSATKTFKTEASPVTPPEITLPTVVTAEVTEITFNSAQCGGEVTNDGGAKVTERGICWSVNANPTLNDSHVASGTGIGAFTAMMNSLETNTTYHVRAYATNEKGTAYGLDREFLTEEGCDCGYVDLGLPSGLLWASCNVGAITPEDYGDYFAWGETQPKKFYDYSSYQHCLGSGETYTKYCDNPDYGFVDNLTFLLPENDAATINLGNGWRIPSKVDWQELFDNTTHTWTTQNGENGMLFTATNGHSIFLPACGMIFGSNPSGQGLDGMYMSSSLYLGQPHYKWICYFGSTILDLRSDDRIGGRSIRAVYSVPNPNELPTVVTDDVSEITPHSVVCSGEVISDGGFEVTECGICWDIEENPTLNYRRVVSGTGTGSYTVSINGLRANTTYHIRAYATNVKGTEFGLDKTFTTSDIGGSVEHEYVDLGLPSGTLWATCNVGAISPEDYGDYFAWGETQPKDTYDWSTYKYCNGAFNQLTKYCNDSNYGYNGFTDNLRVLLPEDDAATANWGNDWCMPSEAAWRELQMYTSCSWTTKNGVSGYLFTATNGNSIFLPAAGLFQAGSNGYYWSNTQTDGSYFACLFGFSSSGCSIGYYSRCEPLTVRPVRTGRKN